MAGRPAGAYLYVLGIEGGPCKVGWGADIDRRRRDLEREYGPVTVFHVAFILRGHALAAERYAHWLLREHHLRGEWFSVSHGEAIKAVETAIAADIGAATLIPPLASRGRQPALTAALCDRADAALGPNETRADLIREAVERELKRRERKA